MAVTVPPKASLSNVPALVPQGAHAGSPPLMLKRPATMIGSDPHCHLHLISSTVSKSHAIIVANPQGAYIHDLASRTRVLVNDNAVRETWLKDGDRVQIGKFVFKFVAPKVPAAPAGPDAVKAVLDVQDSVLPVPIEGKVIVIGRRPSSDIPLLEASVSTCHAVIYEMGGRRYLRDLYSRTGTFLNGTKIHQEEIRIGDRIRIGETDIQIKAVPESTAIDELDREIARTLDEAKASPPAEADPTNPLAPISPMILNHVAEAPDSLVPISAAASDEIELDADLDVSTGPGKTAVFEALAEAPVVPPQLPPSATAGDSVSDLSEADRAAPMPVSPQSEGSRDSIDPELPQRGWHSTAPADIEPIPVEPPAPEVIATTGTPAVDAEEFAIDHTPPPPIEAEPETAVEPEVVEQPITSVDVAPAVVDSGATVDAAAVATPAEALVETTDAIPMELRPAEPPPVIELDAPQAPQDISAEASPSTALSPPVQPENTETTGKTKRRNARKAVDKPLVEKKPPAKRGRKPKAKPQDQAPSEEANFTPPAVDIPAVPPVSEETAAPSMDIVEAIPDVLAEPASTGEPSPPLVPAIAKISDEEIPDTLLPPPEITGNVPLLDQDIAEFTENLSAAEVPPVDSAPVEGEATATANSAAVEMPPDVQVENETSETSAAVGEDQISDLPGPVDMETPSTTDVSFGADTEADELSAELPALESADVMGEDEILLSPSEPIPAPLPPTLEATVDTGAVEMAADQSIAVESEPPAYVPPAVTEADDFLDAPVPVDELDGIDFSDLVVDLAAPSGGASPGDLSEMPADPDGPIDSHAAAESLDYDALPASDGVMPEQETPLAEVSQEAQVFEAVIRHEAAAAPKLGIEPAIAGLQVRPEDFSATVAPPESTLDVPEAEAVEPADEIPELSIETPEAEVHDSIMTTDTSAVVPSGMDDDVVAGAAPVLETVSELDLPSIIDPPIISPAVEHSDAAFAAMVEEFTSQPAAPVAAGSSDDPTDQMELLPGEPPPESLEGPSAASSVEVDESLGDIPQTFDDADDGSPDLDAPLPPAFTYDEAPVLETHSTDGADLAPLPPPFTFSEEGRADSAMPPPRPSVTATGFGNEPFTLDDGFFGSRPSIGGAQTPPQTIGTVDPGAATPDARISRPDMAPPSSPLAEAIAAAGFGLSAAGGISSPSVDNFIGGMPLRLPDLASIPSTFGKISVSFDSRPPTYSPAPLTDDTLTEAPPEAHPGSAGDEAAVPHAPEAEETPNFESPAEQTPPPAGPVITTPPPAFSTRRPRGQSPGLGAAFSNAPVAGSTGDAGIRDLSEAFPSTGSTGGFSAPKAGSPFDGLAMPPLGARDPFSLSAPQALNNAAFGAAHGVGTGGAYVPESPEAAASQNEKLDRDFADDEFWDRTDDDDANVPAGPAKPEAVDSANSGSETAEPAEPSPESAHPPDDGDIVAQADRSALAPGDEPEAAPETAVRATRQLHGPGRPPVTPVDSRKPPANPGQPLEPRKKRKRSFFGFLGVIMFLCIGGALAAIWFRPVPARVTALVNFRNVDLIDRTSASAKFINSQLLLLQDDQTRVAALKKLKAEQPNLKPGFLGDVKQYRQVAADAEFPPDKLSSQHQASLALHWDGVDAAGDASRMAALAETVIDTDLPKAREGTALRGAADRSIVLFKQKTNERAELARSIGARKQLVDQAPTNSDFDRLTKEYNTLKAAYFAASAAVDNDQLAIQHLQSEAPGDNVSRPGAATQAKADSELERIHKEIGDLSRQLADAAATQPAEAVQARAVLEQANQELTDQLADASRVLDGSSKLKDFVESAKQSQANARELTTRLITDGMDFEKQLEAIRNRMDENIRQRQQQMWEHDPSLKELRDNLDIAQHKYNAAAGGGLNDPRALAAMQQEISRQTAAIQDRQAQLTLDPGDTAISRAVNALVDEQRKKIETEKSDIDKVMEPLNKGFEHSMTTVDALPAAQQKLAGQIQQRLAALAEARQRYTAATSSVQASTLQKQLDDLRAAAAQRERAVAEEAKKSLSEQQQSAMAAAVQKLDADRRAMVDAHAKYDEKSIAFDSAQRLRNDARPISAQIDDLSIQLGDLDRSLATLAADKDAAQAKLADAVSFDVLPFNRKTDVEVSSSVDHRSDYSLYSVAAVCLVFFSVVLALSSRNREDAEPQPARPATIEQINDFPGADLRTAEPLVDSEPLESNRAPISL